MVCEMYLMSAASALPPKHRDLPTLLRVVELIPKLNYTLDFSKTSQHLAYIHGHARLQG